MVNQTAAVSAIVRIAILAAPPELPSPDGARSARTVRCRPRVVMHSLTFVVHSAQRLLAACLLILRMASSGLSAVLRRLDAVARRRPPPPPLPGLANILLVTVFMGRISDYSFALLLLLLAFAPFCGLTRLSAQPRRQASKGETRAETQGRQAGRQAGRHHLSQYSRPTLSYRYYRTVDLEL